MASIRNHGVIALLRLMPRNLLSRLAGRLVSIRLPKGLRAPMMRAYARIFGADLSEVAEPLADFPSVQDFFVRALRPGARPVDPDPSTLVSPCDGAWGQWGTVEQGTLLQIKGRPYSLAELLGDADDAARFEGGTYATLYLSPKDYHRFHAPCRARVSHARYLPGSLWPVNQAGVELVDGLFARNERICAFMDVAEQACAGHLCLVAVGATMVGKVKVVFDDLETNLPRAKRKDRDYEPKVELERGQEWGRFLFGSTLVLIAMPGTLDLAGQPMGSPLRLGSAIGRLNQGKAAQGKT